MFIHNNIMKRTSSTQFEIMLEFMEQNGDLCSKIDNPQNRIKVIQEWEELTNLLNNDPCGGKKPTEKWKKVWSDLKNNTKRKALKLSAALSKGDHTSLNRPLSYYRSHYIKDQRVLNIMRDSNKVPSDASISEDNSVTQDSAKTVTSLSPQQEMPEHPPPPPITPPAFVELPDDKPTSIEVDEAPMDVCTNQELEQPGPLRRPNNTTSPPISESSFQSESLIPAIEGQIPKNKGIPKLKNRRVFRSFKKSRKRPADKSTERLMKYVIQKGRAEIEIEKERLRLREIELSIQRNWQQVAVKAIDALHKVIDTKLN